MRAGSKPLSDQCCPPLKNQSSQDLSHPEHIGQHYSSEYDKETLPTSQLSEVVPEGSKLAKLRQELSRRESHLQTQAKSFMEELNANHATVRAFSEETSTIIGSLKVSHKAWGIF